MIHIDIETYCDLDIKDVGAYRYAEDASFRVLLFAYAFDDEPVTVIDCSEESFPGEALPAQVWAALTDPSITKVAHNANFERTCLAAYYGLAVDPREWTCTMIAAAYLGLPLKLEEVCKVLGLTEQKDARGKALLTYFCKPCKPTKANGGRTRNLPEHAPEKWEAFKAYNAQDVRAEIAIHRYTSGFPALPDTERAYWVADQRINGTGITVDREFIEAAIDANERFIREVHEEMISITGVDNPNSLPQLKAWFRRETGYEASSLGADYLADAIAGGLLPPHVERVLRLRQLASKTSIAKYSTMLAWASPIDSRIRGLVQFYGANRTGRFSGRGAQVQNLKRTLKRGLLTAREAVLKGVADLLYTDVPDVISRLTRTALVAADGCTLVASDFASIEARAVAWLAGEEWALEVFRTHGRIYEATAASMFNVPIDSITGKSELRAKGKIATLALGYQGSVGALIAMGALRDGLTDGELPALVSRWRVANPHIVRMWHTVERVTKHAISRRCAYTLRMPYCALTFSYDRGYLFIELPSGRRLAYYGAAVEREKITYWGMDQTKKRWLKQSTYGGSLVENITQAVARDCLCDAMLRMHEQGINILMHVHDEVIAEVRDGEAEAALELMNNVMAVSPAWAEGLPLKGDGFISKFYKKE
jgi:DNA polymerase